MRDDINTLLYQEELAGDNVLDPFGYLLATRTPTSFIKGLVNAVEKIILMAFWMSGGEMVYIGC